jgi:uncharacterized membrane protein YedE/YeeE
MKKSSLLAVLLCGVLFGAGLSLASMVKPEVVIDFLLFRDLGLLLVLGTAVLVTLLAYQLGPKVLKKPVFEARFADYISALDVRTLLGAGIFGLGWGICGVCPGPAIAGLGVGNWPLLYALAGIAAGAYVQGRWFPPR